MILSDRDIKAEIESGRVKIAPDPAKMILQGNTDNIWVSDTSDYHIHASSMDLHLGNTFKLYEHSKYAILDPKNPDTFAQNMRTITIDNDEPFIVQPGEFILGVTREVISIPDDLVVRVEGRSSLGRLGIIVHSTAGFVDPGFEGTITLEISNLNRLPVALYANMRVCQIAFEKMTSKADTPYHKKANSKYQGQILPEESRLAKDPEFATK